MTGTIIKTLRNKANMSQDELAKLSGYNDRSSIAKIESGKVDLPESKIKQFSKIFSVTPAALMGFEPLNDSQGEKREAEGKKADVFGMLSEEENELIEKYRKLTIFNQGRIFQQTDSLLDSQTKGKEKCTISVG